MSGDSLAILDVGHGNGAVLIVGKTVIVIDAGPGSAVIEYLRQHGVGQVDTLILSHADQDHIEGAIGLVASGEFEIGCIRMNPDASKRSALWGDLVLALEKTEAARHTRLELTLVSENKDLASVGRVRVQVLAPRKAIAATGAGGNDPHGRRLTTNSMSAVVRILQDDVPLALFPGDLDQVGLENLLETCKDGKAAILVFPHHGGLPGGDLDGFVRRICELVIPSVVVFSIGRGAYANPRPEIVSAVRKYRPKARILCTQLSEHCAAKIPETQSKHLHASFARGRESVRCCSGSIYFSLGGPKPEMFPPAQEHLAFIRANAPTAMCLR